MELPFKVVETVFGVSGFVKKSFLNHWGLVDQVCLFRLYWFGWRISFHLGHGAPFPVGLNRLPRRIAIDSYGPIISSAVGDGIWQGKILIQTRRPASLLAVLVTGFPGWARPPWLTLSCAHGHLRSACLLLDQYRGRLIKCISLSRNWRAVFRYSDAAVSAG